VVFVFCCLLSGLTPLALSAICPPNISSGCSRSARIHLLIKLPKSRITAHLHSFIPLLPHLWNKLPHSLQSHSSLKVFKTAVHHHLLSSPIQHHDLFYPRSSNPNPPPLNSLLSFLKVLAVSILFTLCTLPHPSTFHRSPHVSVPHCFVLPSPTLLVSCSPCLCSVLALTRASTLHAKNPKNFMTSSAMWFDSHFLFFSF